MKFTQEQIDEGVKDLVTALLGSAAIGVGLQYSIDQFNKSREPIETKIQAVEKAKEISKDSKFDRAMDDLLKQYTPTIEKKSKAVLVKPLKRYDNLMEPSLEDFRKFIIPSEIYGNSIEDSENRKFLKPYKDDVGLWTIGIGHLIGKGTESDMREYVKKFGGSLTTKQVIQMFEGDVAKHVNIAKRKFGNQWDLLSPEIKKALVDISFRGDLLKPNSKDDFDFIKQIKEGKFKEASKTYLKHKEYKKRKLKSGNKDGVVKRMNRNSKIIEDEAFKYRQRSVQ